MTKLKNKEVFRFEIRDGESDYNEAVYYINKAIKKYEERYRTNVYGVALIGVAQTWQGRYPAGKLAGKDARSILSTLGKDIKEIIIEIDPASKLTTLYGIHHDGTHQMSLYVVNDSRAEKLGLRIGDMIIQSRLSKYAESLPNLYLNDFYNDYN